MISCLIGLIIVVIVAVICLAIFELAIGAIVSFPPQVIQLVRLLVGLLVLLYFLGCIGGFVSIRFPVAYR